jgi:hypothetical protein
MATCKSRARRSCRARPTTIDPDSIQLGIITLTKHPQEVVNATAPCEPVVPHGAGAPEGFILVEKDRLFQEVAAAVLGELGPTYDGQLSASRSQAESIAYAVLLALEEQLCLQFPPSE